VLAVAAALAGCGGSSRPSGVVFGKATHTASGRDVEVTFKSHGTKLAGTLHLPSGRGPYPAVVWLHGSGPEARDDAAPYYTPLLGRFAVFAYDKRGAGASGGTCCPLDFRLLADDASAAVAAVRSYREIDRGLIGLMALSQGGWLMPLTALSSPVGFAIVVAGSAVSLGEESLSPPRPRRNSIPARTSRAWTFPFSGCTEHSTRASRSTRTSPP
jgi:pimeloyl-ACP methyl ester carboxylesterase